MITEAKWRALKRAERDAAFHRRLRAIEQPPQDRIADQLDRQTIPAWLGAVARDDAREERCQRRAGSSHEPKLRRLTLAGDSPYPSPGSGSLAGEASQIRDIQNGVRGAL